MPRHNSQACLVNDIESRDFECQKVSEEKMVTFVYSGREPPFWLSFVSLEMLIKHSQVP